LETTKKNESNTKDSTNRPIEITNTAVTVETARDAIATFEIINNSGVQITSAGVCWSTSQNPTINDSKWYGYHQSSGNKWEVSIESLEKGTTYYLRAFAAILGFGTFYGIEVSFTTPSSSPPIAFNPNLTYGSIEDIDGNVYKTIQIGSQIWMAENLKTTKYSDGSPILFGTGGPAGYTDWFDAGDGNYLYYNGAYCWYDNDSSTYKDVFGAIYNWHAVGTGKLCPTGWHVPDNSEWTTLITTLGGVVIEDFNEITGNSLIESDNNYESGFTLILAGELYGWGFGRSSFFWSATPRPTELFVPYAYIVSPFYILLYEPQSYCFSLLAWEPQSYGFSVRCLKD